MPCADVTITYRRAPHGARGLKYADDAAVSAIQGRAPHGARGLKYNFQAVHQLVHESRPAWGAWIEISFLLSLAGAATASRPAWGAWIEICGVVRVCRHTLQSRPAWGAWIEMENARGEDEGFSCRAPHGARGLKSRWEDEALYGGAAGRAPHGARGLK